MKNLEFVTVSGTVEDTKTPEQDIPKPYTYDEALEITGHGRYNYRVLFTCCVIVNAVALDMFGFGLIVAASACDLELTMETKGLLSSSPFAGIIFAFPWGYFADTRGRRRALVWSAGVGFLFAALSSLANSAFVMAACKFIGCSFSTASFSLTMTYLGESTGGKHRARYLQVMNSINLASEAVMFSVALLILPLNFTTAPLPWLGITWRPWRLLTLLTALPMGLGAILVATLHESPKFLANRGREDEALKVMEDVFGRNGGKGTFPIKSLISTQNEDESKKISFWSSIVKQSLPIFKPPLLSKTAMLFYLVVIICSTNNAFVMWYPLIMNSFFVSLDNDQLNGVSFCNRVFDNVTAVSDDGLNMELCSDVISYKTLYSGIGMGVFFLTSNLVVSRVSHHRRLALLSIFTVSTASCILLNFVHHPVANLVFFVLIQCTGVGLGIGASYFNDLFPTSYRALATSLGLMMGRLGSILGVNLIGMIIENHCDVTFYSWATFVFSGFLVTLLLPC